MTDDNNRPTTHKRQVREFRAEYEESGRRYVLKAEARFDDSCGNGHDTFSVTGEIYNVTHSRRLSDRNLVSAGCIHDEIAAHVPELAPVLKWHMCSTDGPLHYLANTTYHASDRDHWGKRAGEPRTFSTSIRFGRNPIRHRPGGSHVAPKFVAWLEERAAEITTGGGRFDFEVIRIDHDDRGRDGRYQFGPKFTFGGFGARWHECPFEGEGEALEFLEALRTCEPTFVRVATAWGEGKAPDLEAARRSAIWPDATLDQLQDRAALEARLPALVAEFRRDMESLGFEWLA